MSTNDLAGLQAVVGRLFIWGVRISASAFVAGLALFFAHSTLATPVLRSGLVVLMMIPAARVLVSALDAMRRRDTLIVAATLAVIVELVWLFASKR